MCPQIRTQNGFIEQFNKERIVEAITKDAKFLKSHNGNTNIDQEEIKKIAAKVKRLVDKMDFSEVDTLSSDTIRGLVVSELYKMGETDLANISEIIGIRSRELMEIWRGDAYADNANLNGKTPEAQHKYIADNISKKGSIKLLLPEDIAYAHSIGRIHIHDLDYFANRPFCNEHDLRYYLYYGLYADGTGDSIPIACPAKDAEVAVLHAAKALGSAQGNFAGGQGFQNFLTFLSPFMEGKDYKYIKQQMQRYIYEMSQMMNARGGQAVFSTTQLTPGIPEILKDIPVVYKGKIHDGIQAPLRIYGEFEREVRLMFKAYTEIMYNGDAFGRPFSFPKYEVEILPEHWIGSENYDKPLMRHIKGEDLAYLPYDEEIGPSYQDLWMDMCKLIAKDGTPYIHNALDTKKGSIHCYSCCAYEFQSDISSDPAFNDKLHFKNGEHFILGSKQVGTMNLPQAAYYANGDIDKFMEYNIESIKLLVKMFKIKENLISNQSLPFARQTPIDPNDSKKRAPVLWNGDALPYCIGIVGLNEAIQSLIGKQIHESKDAHKLAINLLIRLQMEVKKAQEDGLKLAFARTPAETTAQRFAVCDLLNGYKDQAIKVMKGDIRYSLENIENTTDLPIFYTNGAMCANDADINVFQKIRLEEHAFSAFDGGNIFHFFLGEENPSPEGIMDLLEKMLGQTNIKYFAFTKDYTLCKNCNANMGGLRETCNKCGSDDVTQFSRITGYIQAIKGKKISGWNKGKIEELKKRKRYNVEQIKG